MFNYHNKAKSLIKSGHLVEFKIEKRWNNISPALVLFFDNHKPMPIRKYNQVTGACNWDMYWPMINKE